MNQPGDKDRDERSLVERLRSVPREVLVQRFDGVSCETGKWCHEAADALAVRPECGLLAGDKPQSSRSERAPTPLTDAAYKRALETLDGDHAFALGWMRGHAEEMERKLAAVSELQRPTPQQLWDRFMDHLAKVEPTGSKATPHVHHANLLGSADKYRKIFLASLSNERNSTDA